MKKLLKNLTFAAIASLTVASVQAQTPIVELKFDNNLTNTGSSALMFNTNLDAALSTLTVPYDTDRIEGSHSLNWSSLDRETDEINWIQNGPVADIQSTTNLGITGDNPRTISAWFKYANDNTDTNGGHTIVTIGDPNAGSGVNLRGKMQFTYEPSAGRVQIAVAGGRIDYTILASDNLDDFNWHHAAFVVPVSGTGASSAVTLADVQMYIDGQPVASSAGGNDGQILTTIDDKVYVGSDGKNGSKWFDGGGIDDVRIYNVELTAAQMLAVYNENVLSIAGFAFGELKAYPNAVEDFLYIKTTSNDSLQISVYDITGKQIIRTVGDSIDMRDLNSGIYIVKVRQDNKVANLKILKK